MLKPQAMLMLLQVGMHGGPAPWKATHSIYSMFLLNVELTVNSGVFWPAKPYHDDIDFPRLCEENGLVAAKCQWLFLHKVSRICPELGSCMYLSMHQLWSGSIFAQGVHLCSYDVTSGAT